MFILKRLAIDPCTGLDSCTLADKVMYINSILLIYTHICLAVCPKTGYLFVAREAVGPTKRWKERIAPSHDCQSGGVVLAHLHLAPIEGRLHGFRGGLCDVELEGSN